MNLKAIWPAATLLLFALPAQADDTEESAEEEVTLVLPAARQGYFVALGGGASLSMSDSDKEGSIGPIVGSAFNLRFGEMVTDWLGFSFHANIGLASDDRWDTLFGGALLDAQLVPYDHLAIHFGAGAGGIRLTDKVEEQESLLGTGGGYYMVGASYDLFPFHDEGESGGFSLTPAVRVFYLPGSTFQSTLITFGLDVTWWSGLNKNRLVLPDDEAYDD